MASIVVVGDGPGGLSAALFLARANNSVVVFGTDNTAVSYTHLRAHETLRHLVCRLLL